MNTEKLLLLADLLEMNAADEKGMKFDLDVVNRLLEGTKYTRSCGTSGCAIGLACVSDEFPDLEPSSSGWITYKGNERWWANAAADEFDISLSEVNRLFLMDFYPKSLRRGAESELAVAARIRSFVADPHALKDLPEYET